MERAAQSLQGSFPGPPLTGEAGFTTRTLPLPASQQPKPLRLFIVADQSHSPTVLQHATGIAERTFVSHELFVRLFTVHHAPANVLTCATTGRDMMDVHAVSSLKRLR